MSAQSLLNPNTNEPMAVDFYELSLSLAACKSSSRDGSASKNPITSSPSIETTPMITPTSSCDSVSSNTAPLRRPYISIRNAHQRRKEAARVPNRPTRPVVVTPSRPSKPLLRVLPSLTPSTDIPPGHHLIYLIRHGQSKGQLAPKSQRLKDSSLLDCGLTPLGQQQALTLRQTYQLPPMDLVVSSPLTRALQTATLAFPDAPKILVHYDLRELGKPNVPENCPRPWDQVLSDLPPSFSVPRIDTQSLLPQQYQWPQQHGITPTVIRRNHHIPRVFSWLASQQASPPRRIAVVCHFHVIRAALAGNTGVCPSEVQPDNAVPIPCLLTPQGRLMLWR